jgi:hypothetical protein
MQRGFFLRGLDNERNSFCSLASVETLGGGLATARRFEQPLVMVPMTSGGAP